MAEIAGRTLFPEGGSGDHGCMILNNPKRGVTGIPNSVCREKIPESGWVEYRLNNCGHRAGVECGPKPDDSYRIALIGSSYEEGYSVPREQSFAALLPALLSKSLGCRIELYNEGMQWGTAHAFALRFADVLSVQPDMILWPVTPWDVYNAGVSVPPALLATKPQAQTRDRNTGDLNKLRSRLTAGWNRGSERLYESKAVFMVRHFLYADANLYVKAAALDRKDYGMALASVPSPEWNLRLRRFAEYLGEMEHQAKRVNVPFVVMSMPGHAQADMIASGIWPQSLDPYIFGEQLRVIARQEGATYIDLLPFVREIPNVHDDFYRVNEHPNVAGHAAFARIMAEALGDRGVLSPHSVDRKVPAACAVESR